MKSILEEIWYGNISPNETGRKATKEEKELVGRLSDTHDEHFATLSDKQKETFAKFQDVYSELSCISEREIFIYAFRLGARIAFEVMNIDFK